MARRLALLLAAACLLAGCGEEAGGDGTATVWVTRDRGAQVMLDTTVPSGISALEAVRRKADVETRYGGRYIQSIDGVEGSLTGQHDWFFFVNGYEADLSAVDYELRDGDVLWWDHRSWSHELRQPVVVGAFPEPFLHGWMGKRRPTVIEGGPPELVQKLATLTGGSAGDDPEANRLRLVPGKGFRGTLEGGPGGPVVFTLGRETAQKLVDDPDLARFRYSIP